LGPWIVDASDIPDPQNLWLRTTVNGEVVQDGSTSDMILPVAQLVSYLAETMTLMPGDMIMTGTPQGVHFCAAGDEVVCEIEGIGRLVNRLTGEGAP
jgi:5-oxopent-3-ene-1,2,5-tricarboxylate decarboxylase/2-hydroxyhepta-2,4-diene-1,7-dioate isomerase